MATNQPWGSQSQQNAQWLAQESMRRGDQMRRDASARSGQRMRDLQDLQRNVQLGQYARITAQRSQLPAAEGSSADIWVALLIVGAFVVFLIWGFISLLSFLQSY